MKKQLATLAFAIAAASLNTAAFAAPETYVADSSHTFSRFSYSHFGYSTQISRFNKTTGKVMLDKAAKTGAVDIEIDTKSVDTGSDTFPYKDHHEISGPFYFLIAKPKFCKSDGVRVVFYHDFHAGLLRYLPSNVPIGPLKIRNIEDLSAGLVRDSRNADADLKICLRVQINEMTHFCQDLLVHIVNVRRRRKLFGLKQISSKVRKDNRGLPRRHIDPDRDRCSRFQTQ